MTVTDSPRRFYFLFFYELWANKSFFFQSVVAGLVVVAGQKKRKSSETTFECLGECAPNRVSKFQDTIRKTRPCI